MIDFGDVDTFSDAGIIVGGGVGVILLVIALCLYLAAADNAGKCKELAAQCPPGTQVQLMDHACRCVGDALPMPNQPAQPQPPRTEDIQLYYLPAPADAGSDPTGGAHADLETR